MNQINIQSQTDFLDLRRIIFIILRRFWLIVIFGVIGFFVGREIGSRITPVYEATATLMVGQISQLNTLDRTDILNSEVIIQTYSDIVSRQPILEEVVKKSDLAITWQQLRKQVHVNPVEGTQLMEIKVEASNPEDATALADMISEQLLSVANSTSQNNDVVQEFIHKQLDDLRNKILNGQDQLIELHNEEAELSSPVDLEAKQSEIVSLEETLTQWVNSYISLTQLVEKEKLPDYLTSIGSAQASNEPIRPNILLNSIIGSGLGIVLGLGFVILLDLLDDTYKSLDDITIYENINPIGAIGAISGNDYPEKLITYLEPYSPISESYRIIRSKVRKQSSFELMKSIIVTSPTPGDGKSTTAVNFAITLSQAGFKTVIIDADLRRPTIHKYFNADNEAGLSDLLTNRSTKVSDYLLTTEIRNLLILPSGKEIIDPSEQFSTVHMSEILKELEKHSDIIIIDSPPILPVADVLELANHAEGLLLVIQAGKTKRKDIKLATSNILNVRAKYLGVILNKVSKADSQWSYHGYYKTKGRLYQIKDTFRLIWNSILKPFDFVRTIIYSTFKMISRFVEKPKQSQKNPTQLDEIDQFVDLSTTRTNHQFSNFRSILAKFIPDLQDKSIEYDQEHLRQLAQKKRTVNEQLKSRDKEIKEFIKNLPNNRLDQMPPPEEQKSPHDKKGRSNIKK